LTRIGLVGLFLGALWLGLRHQDLVLIGASLFALGALAWGALTVVLTRLVLAKAIALSEHPSRIEGSSDEETLTGWHWRVPAWLPLATFSSDLNGYPTHFVRVGGRLSEVACFPRRRLQDGLWRQFVISDFLGISTWSFQDRQNAVLRILPTVDSGHGIAPPISVVSGADLPDPYSAETGDRLDMRRYRSGDPLRLVLWSIYQRSGHLMVRAPEKAVSQHQRTGLYLLTNPKDRPAAKLVRVLLEQDALGPQWRFGADGALPWAHHNEQALNALADSGTLESPARVYPFLQDLARDRFGKCLILVTDDPENRNHKLAMLAHGQRLPRLSLEIWVVFDPPNVPARNTFPTIAGAEMLLIERRGAGFKMVPW
jgi:hypothetical protein